MQLRTLFVIAMLARAAAAQSVPSAQLPPALRASIDRIADSARAHRIPTDPLYSKAAEGVLKNADNTRIVDAVSRLEHELESARSILGARASDAELVAAASVLHAGVDTSLVRKLASAREETRGTKSLVLPLVVLADLIARHVTTDVAVSSVASMMSHGASDAQYNALRQNIERDIAAGRPPDAAVRSRTDAAVQGLGPTLAPKRPDQPND